MLASCLANTSAPPSVFPARGTDSLQDPFLELILAFSGRPAGRPVSAPLRERAAAPPGISPARCPCLAAPPLRPVAPVSSPRPDPPFPLLDHRGGGRLRSAPQARGAAAGVLPSALPAPRRFASRAPWARLGSPDPSPQSTRRSTCARTGRARRYVRRRSAVTTSGEDVCSLPVTTPSGRGRGGTWFSPGKRRVGSMQMGDGAGRGPLLSLSRMRSRCSTPIPIVVRPSWGKQVSSDKATPSTLCVNFVSRVDVLNYMYQCFLKQ